MKGLDLSIQAFFIAKKISVSDLFATEAQKNIKSVLAYDFVLRKSALSAG